MWFIEAGIPAGCDPQFNQGRELQMKKLYLLVAMAAAATLSGCATNKDVNGQSKLACIGLPCLMPWNKFPDEKPNEAAKPTAVSPKAEDKTSTQPDK